MKNDPPVGSTPSEVADDIPAMISEGEFVIPANVVRYIGLDKIRDMMHQAKHGLACMEDEGLIVDVDEEGKPQSDQKEKSEPDVAILETIQIEKVDPMMTQMAGGGMTDKDGPIVSPILNPENKPLVAEGGLIMSPDGSLKINMAEGGMPVEMSVEMPDEMPTDIDSEMGAMMMEEMSSESPDEMAMPPELADEMAPQEAEPMPEAPMMNAPVAQEFNGVPHLMTYLKEDEIKALQEAGRGIDENGEQMLSPEGIPVFSATGGGEAGADETGEGPTDQGGPANTGSDPADQGFGPGADVGPAGTDSENEAEEFKELSKEIKKELSPENDREYVEGVGFIDKYIAQRNNRLNPLQGQPQYAVATVAQGGLMRSPEHLMMNTGGTPSRTTENYLDPSKIRSSLYEQYKGKLDEPTMTYLSNNSDVLRSLVDGKPTYENPQELMDASKKHFNEFGKTESRKGAGLYLAQEKFPDMINPETGSPTVYAGQAGYYDAAKILEAQPNISDESLNYLTKNKDVFKDAFERVSNEEGTTYEDVATQHYNAFGKTEERRGATGFESLFTKPEQNVEVKNNTEANTRPQDPRVTNAADKAGIDPIAGANESPVDNLDTSLMSPKDMPKEEPKGTGFFNDSDVKGLKAALEKANFGNQDSLLDDSGNIKGLVDAGGGTYDIAEGSNLGLYLGGYGSDEEGAIGGMTTVDKATFRDGPSKGQPLSRQQKMLMAENTLSMIDESA